MGVESEAGMPVTLRSREGRQWSPPTARRAHHGVPDMPTSLLDSINRCPSRS
jgi:hypothetical protein